MPKKFKDMEVGTWFLSDVRTMKDCTLEKTGDTTAVEIVDPAGEQKPGEEVTINPETSFVEPWEP